MYVYPKTKKNHFTELTLYEIVFTGALSAAMASRYIKTKANLSAAIALGGAGITILNLYSFYSSNKKWIEGSRQKKIIINQFIKLTTFWFHFMIQFSCEAHWQFLIFITGF